MTKRLAAHLLAACGLGLGLMQGAGASTLYGSTFSESSLFTVNQSTGAIAPVGPMNAVIGDMTSNPGTGTVWGIGLTGNFNNLLYTVNTATGAASSPLTITGTEGPITSIAYDTATGTMYGNTTSGFGGADRLYRIDLGTGAATLIGGGIGWLNVYALGFAGGQLYGVSDATDEFIRIDTGTGAGALLGATGLEFVFDIAARPEDGVMFAADSATASLYTVNLADGAMTLVGPYGSTQNIAGLAFVGEVPEPSTYVLMLAGLLGLGWVARRRAG